MFATITRTALAAAAVAALLTAGAAVAGDGPGDTTMTIGPRVAVTAPSPSPVDFPGFRGDRPGQPLPRGYVAVSHAITITRGETTAIYPTFTMSCPAGTRLRTMAAEGDVSPQVVGRTPFVRRRSFEYIGRRSWGIVVDYDRREVGVGETVSGKVHALCR